MNDTAYLRQVRFCAVQSMVDRKKVTLW
jgi:hypothetical protein